MSFELKQFYAGVPATERGRAAVISHDLKTKSKLAYGCGTNVYMRDIKDPLNVEIYTEHSYNVTCARFSPSGYYICSGDAAGYVRVWATDNEDKTLKLEVRPVSGAVRDIAWSPDSKRIVVVGEGKGTYGAVFLWDSGSTVGEVSGHSNFILSCDMKPNRPYKMVTGGEDNTVAFFKGPPFKFEVSNNEHTRYVNCVRYSPDGEKFVSVSSDKTGKVFQGKTGEKIAELGTENAHKGSIYSVAWAPDSKTFATASADKTVKIWDAESLKVVKTFSALDNHLEFMQVGSTYVDENTLITLSLNGDINYYDPNGNEGDKPTKVLHGHNASIRQLVFNKKDDTFYTAGANGVLIKWKRGEGSVTRVLGKPQTGLINCIAITDGKLVVISADSSVRYVDLDSFAYGGVAFKITGLACDAKTSVNDSSLVVVAAHNGINILKDEKLVNFIETSYEPLSIDISPDDKRIAVGGKDKKVRIYDFDGKDIKESVVLTSHRGVIASIKYSPNGKLLAVGDGNREVIVWDTESNTEKYTGLVFHNSTVFDLDWNSQSTHLLSGSNDQNLIVWDLENKNRAKVLAHRLGVSQSKFVDDSTVISCGQDFCIKEWGFKF